MKVFIIEDEPLGAEALIDMLVKINPEIQVLSVADSIRSSVEFLQNSQAPDLIFMDIELADGQSFQIFNEVEVNSPVIFTTSYDEYALKAFKLNGIDYLLKPVTEKDLKKSLEKVHNLKHQLHNIVDFTKNIDALIRQWTVAIPKEDYRERFLVKQGQKFISIELEEISYFFSEEKMTFIKSKTNKDFLLNYSLDELERMLPPKKFLRINRHIIATHQAIVQIHTWFNGKLKILLSPPLDEEVIISRDKAKDFKKWMGE